MPDNRGSSSAVVPYCHHHYVVRGMRNGSTLPKNFIASEKRSKSAKKTGSLTRSGFFDIFAYPLANRAWLVSSEQLCPFLTTEADLTEAARGTLRGAGGRSRGRSTATVLSFDRRGR